MDYARRLISVRRNSARYDGLLAELDEMFTYKYLPLTEQDDSRYLMVDCLLENGCIMNYKIEYIESSMFEIARLYTNQGVDKFSAIYVVSGKGKVKIYDAAVIPVDLDFVPMRQSIMQIGGHLVPMADNPNEVLKTFKIKDGWAKVYNGDWEYHYIDSQEHKLTPETLEPMQVPVPRDIDFLRNRLEYRRILKKDTSDLKILFKRHIKKYALMEQRALEREGREMASFNDFKYELSVCLLVKDENQYLREWIQWYLDKGFEHVYIYDNGGTVVPEELKDYCEVIDWTPGHYDDMQYEAYYDCLKRARFVSKWVAFLDSDEFIDYCGSLKSYLKLKENKCGLFLPWKIYNAAGREHKQTEGVVKSFTETCWYPAVNGKTIVQPLLTKISYVHQAGALYPNFPFETPDYYGIQAINMRKEDYIGNKPYVRHYYTKSLEEWCEKIKRGSCDGKALKKYDEFFIYNPDMRDLYDKWKPEHVEMSYT